MAGDQVEVILKALRALPGGHMKALAFAILGFSLVAQAHAGPPKPLDITEQRNEAVGFAITQAVAVNDVRLACEGVLDAGTRFPDAERRWLKRNGSYLDAARGWMAYVKVTIAEQEGSVADFQCFACPHVSEHRDHLSSREKADQARVGVMTRRSHCIPMTSSTTTSIGRMPTTKRTNSTMAWRITRKP